MMEWVDYNQASRVFKALGNPLRLRIVHTLLRDGCRNVGYLEETCQMSQSCISQHLQKLRAEEIVCAKRQGNEVYYRISNPGVGAILETFFKLEVAHEV